jgi:hypothetical protein
VLVGLASAKGNLDAGTFVLVSFETPLFWLFGVRKCDNKPAEAGVKRGGLASIVIAKCTANAAQMRGFGQQAAT